MFEAGGRRRWRPITGTLAGATLALLLPGCAALPAEFNLSPVFRQRLDAEGRALEVDVLWPLFHYERTPEGGDDFRIRPFWRRITGHDPTGVVEHQFLWPFGRSVADPVEQSSRLFPFWWHRDRENDKGQRETDWYFLFPFVWGGTGAGGGVTRIGNDNLLMAYIHIAHDCIIGNHVILSNNASLAGHVTVADHVILGGFTLVHQFCAIGQHVFAGMGSAIAKDVPPYLIVTGAPAEPHGLNKVGLKRRGFSDEQLLQLSRAYKVLYRQGLSLEEAKVQLQQLGEESEAVRQFAEFLQQSSRSIIR